MILPSARNSTLPEVQPESLSYTFSSNSGILFIFFLLIFYALALWDRWLNLRLRTEENRRLQEAIHRLRDYGSVAGVTGKSRSKLWVPTISIPKVEISKPHEVLSLPSPSHPSPSTSTLDVPPPDPKT